VNLYLPTNEAVIQEKKRLANSLFKGQCYVCRKPFGKGFAFHHIEYDPARRTHKDFPNTIEYNRYLIPEVIMYPERFYCLCKGCHAKIDNWRSGQLGHINKEQLARLFLVAYQTIPKPRKAREKGGESKEPAPPRVP